MIPEHERGKLTDNAEFIKVDLMTPEFFRKLKEERALFVIQIDDSHIKSGDKELLESWNTTLAECGEEALGCKYLLSVHGYDDDPRELYEIPEVAQYITDAFVMFSELFYYLDTESQRWIALCPSFKKITYVNGANKGISIDKAKYGMFIMHTCTMLVEQGCVPREKVDKLIDKMLNMVS